MEKSSFFNAVLDANGTPDRVYPAEDFAEFFSTFIGNGVFPNPSTNLQVLADGTSMNITLKSGKAWINGYFYNNTDDLILTIIPADGVLNRIDRVVLRLDFLNREIKCYVKQGAFASTPTAPSLQRDADMYEIGIADIKVNKGAIAITQANITDLRQNSDYCGIVHGTVEQVDVTTLFNQYENALQLKEQGFEEEFTTWFDSIKGQLSGDVAANLAGQIADINEQLGDIATKCLYLGTTSGTSTAYTSTTDKLTGYKDGDTVTIVPHVDSGTNPTLNINNLGALPLVDSDSNPVQLKVNKPYTFVRVGSYFFIRGGGGGKLKLNYRNNSKMLATLVPLENLATARNLQMPCNGGYYLYKQIGQSGASITIRREKHDYDGNLIENKDILLENHGIASYFKRFKDKIILCDFQDEQNNRLYSYEVLDENMTILGKYLKGNNSNLTIDSGYTDTNLHAIRFDSESVIRIYRGGTLIYAIPYGSSKGYYLGNPEFIDNRFLAVSCNQSTSTSSYGIAIIDTEDGSIAYSNSSSAVTDRNNFGRIIASLLQNVDLKHV